MPLIKNYGLFWKAENVYWGQVGAGNVGHIKGFTAGNAQRTVDFSQQVGTYVLYADYKLVYVGQTGVGNNRLRARLAQHRRDHLAGRWNQFSWFGFRWVRSPNLEDDLAVLAANVPPDTFDVMMNQLEAILIYAAEPPLNRQGGPFGQDVDQYLQYRDRDALGPTEQQILRELWVHLNESRG
ncbi:GIY-YIG nuclease family protein [Rhodopila sp.]|uniref:GIY-YIG nuclease family protein n=1 Tax=Rhodopila sp. TaxID=2480087 RepID=UPI003D1349CC